MYCDSNSLILMRHGWEYYWCDPNVLKNIHIKEVIKGPFTKPKIVNSIPYLTVCQQDGSPIRLSEGIPDCWPEYLRYNLRLSQNHESMHTENVDIVSQLRKNYRLYLGQGIPDPWASYSDDFGIVLRGNLENPKKQFSRLQHRKKLVNNFKKEHCVCCSRKYLFKCPDSCDSSSSFHKHSPGKIAKETNCREKHRNLQNKLLRKINLKYGNKKAPKESSECSPTSSKESSLAADDEEENLCEEEVCRNYKNKLPKEQKNTCSCPYIKNFYIRESLVKNKNENNVFKPPAFASKFIQTEFQPLKKTKSVQTDLKKLQCYTKCYWCNIVPCNSPYGVCKQGRIPGQCEVACPPVCSVPSFYFPPNCTQNPAFVCPYSFSNNFMTYQPHKKKTNKKHSSKKMYLKEKDSEDELKAEFRSNLMHVKSNEPIERNLRWDNTDTPLMQTNYDVLKTDKNIYTYSKSTRPFSHAKYLTNDRLKSYLNQDEISPKAQQKFMHPSSFSGLKSTCFDKGIMCYNPPQVHVEKFKPVSYSTPEQFEYCPEIKKMSPRERNH